MDDSLTAQCKRRLKRLKKKEPTAKANPVQGLTILTSSHQTNSASPSSPYSLGADK
jgi:hypothetical protein